MKSTPRSTETVKRDTASQAVVRGFDPRLPLQTSIAPQPLAAAPTNGHNLSASTGPGCGRNAVPRLNRVAIGQILAVLFCPSASGAVFGVTVDIEDLPRILGRGFWQIHNFKSSHPGKVALYAFRNKRAGGVELLHRFLLGAQRGVLVDHQDHRTLDNRKTQLRCATRFQNSQNARPRRDSSTGLKGITPGGSRYRARIMANGKRISLGSFPTAEEAALAYYQAALIHHGEFAFTNAAKP